MKRNLSDKELWNKIYAGFDNEVCRECCQQIFSSSSAKYISKPQPMPYIGPDFYRSEHRLMFVGIETYGNWPPRKSLHKTGYKGEFGTAEVKRLFFEREKKESGIIYSPFWRWVRTISTEVTSPTRDPQEAFRCIAYSNLHKCQVRDKPTKEIFNDSNYQLDELSFRNCIQRAGWIYKEIEEIGPKNIIVFAGYKEENLLARIFLGKRYRTLSARARTFHYNNSHLTLKDRKKGKGRKDLFVHLRDGKRRFIVTHHPQGTPLVIRKEIIRIIGEGDWSTARVWKMPNWRTLVKG
jgi:hypothetical protein